MRMETETNMKIVQFANSLDPDEVARYEPSHQE